jgi:hypothetical protein
LSIAIHTSFNKRQLSVQPTANAGFVIKRSLNLAVDYLRLDLRWALRALRAMIMTPKQRPHLKGNAAIPYLVSPKSFYLLLERLSLFV